MNKEGSPIMRRDERGIALIIVLFATLLLTVIGLGMMYSTNMETAINHNYRDSQVALYGALAGLQEARDRIKYPYSITPPAQLPSLTSPNIIYIVSDAATVNPWDPTNAYFDTELCQEQVLGLTGSAGVPCTTAASGSAWYSVVDDSSSANAPWNLQYPLAWKWTRIQLKANNNTPVPVNGDPTDNSQACWSGTSQMSTPTTYTTGCQPIGGVNAVNIDSPGTGYASAPTVTLTGGGGTGATATAVMVAETTGYVTSIAVNAGGSYASTPAVTLSGNATATAVLSGSGSTVITGGSVTSASLSAVGSGYTSPPTVTISGGGGAGATAVANLATVGGSVVTGGVVTSTSVSSGGAGYSSAPTVTFSGGGGSGATGTAVMIPDGTGGGITGGTVTATTLTAGGSGYTSAPTVVFNGGGGGTGAAATAVLSSTGTTVTTGTVTTLNLTSGGSSYTSTPTVSLTGGGGSGATATATRGSTGSVTSVSLGSAGTQCYGSASNAVITFTGGGGSGAAASAVLESTPSCVYAVAVTSMPQCTNKLDAANGYSPIDQASGITFTTGNQSFSGTLYVSTANDKSPTNLSVQNPGYDASGYSTATFSSTLRLSSGVWADCGNITATATTGYRIASINLTSGGSGYTSAPTVTITGGTGTTSNPTATSTVGFPITGLTLTSGGTGYTSAPTVSFSGGGGSGAAGTTAVTTGTTTTYPVAAINLVSGGSGYLTTPTITFTGGGGSGAAGSVTAAFTGTATYMVESINITGGGSGYTSAPTISFSGGGSGTGAAAVAGITTTTVTTYAIDNISITSGGAGYTSTPTMTLSGGSGSGAAATANVTFTTATTYPVASITVTSGGSGYTAAPSVTFTGGGGSGGAAATATIGTMNTGTFAIDHITVDTAGSGYSSNPSVTFSGGGGTGGAATSQISGGTKYGKVWLLTSLAVTSTGARSMVQMEVASPVLGWGSGGALTLDGPNPVIDAMPNSINLYIRGQDANSCSETAEVDHPAISGYDDPNANPPTASVETIIDSLPRPDHYLGAGGTPSVQNGFGSIGETMSTPDGLDSVMSAIYNTPGAHHYTPANVGTFSPAATVDSSITYVDGDLALNGTGTGRGILVVTGTLTMSGNFSWYGIVFVVGDGNLQMNGAGNGQIFGSLWVAKTWDSYTTKNILNTMGSPTFGFNGGGNNGIQYDHCYVTNLLNAVNLSSVNSTRPLKVLSYRSIPY
jgi:hypothetical protein